MFTTVASSTTISWATPRRARIDQRLGFCEGDMEEGLSRGETMWR
jgi:hypothetical protein